jgi:hypothetical protein
MKSLSQYLTEAKQTFDYKIYILGDVEADVLNDL